MGAATTATSSTHASCASGTSPRTTTSSCTRATRRSAATTAGRSRGAWTPRSRPPGAATACCAAPPPCRRQRRRRPPRASPTRPPLLGAGISLWARVFSDGVAAGTELAIARSPSHAGSELMEERRCGASQGQLCTYFCHLGWFWFCAGHLLAAAVRQRRRICMAHGVCTCMLDRGQVYEIRLVA